MLLRKNDIFWRPYWISFHRKNAQQLQIGIRLIWTQHILIDQKQQRNIIYVEKQGTSLFQWRLAWTSPVNTAKNSRALQKLQQKVLVASYGCFFYYSMWRTTYQKLDSFELWEIM